MQKAKGLNLTDPQRSFDRIELFDEASPISNASSFA